MKRIVLGIVAFCGAFASAQDSARELAYSACLTQKVPEVDDGISDAATVGRSLRGTCLAEFNAMINDISKRMTIGELKSVDARAAEIKTEYTIRAVLTARVGQRKVRDQESSKRE